MTTAPLTFPAMVAAARGRIRETTVEEVRRRQQAGEAFLLVDVREDGEWAQGRLPGATHVGRGVLEPNIGKVAPDPAAPIVLYCAGGGRSALAADALQALGYTNVASMAGGINAWAGAGLPVER